MKKNLPIDDLKKQLRDIGRPELIKEILFLDSVSESAIMNYNGRMKIPYGIKKTDEYVKFKNDVEFLQSKDNNNDRNYRSFYSSVRNTFSTVNEPAFRRLIQNELFKQFRTVKERINAIVTDDEWKWVGEMYPSVFTSKRQILFMSVDKFLSLNDTIVEKKYMFYNSAIIDNAIIFIDEFDATKETMLRNIIQNGLRDRIDYIELFNEIYSTLKTIDFPKELTIPSAQRMNGEYKDQTLESVLNGIEKIADEIFEQYSLIYNYKTDESQTDDAKNFLFQDHRFLSVLRGNNNYIISKKDPDSKYNLICFSSEKPKAEKNSIQSLLGSLRGFVSWFQIAVHILSINYMQRRNENKAPDDDNFTLENAIESVLSNFRLSYDHKNYLMTQILLNTKKDRGGISGSEYDMTVYERGFRYYAFEDSPEHAMESKIMMYSFQNSPEKFLLRFCEKAKVVGISATATIPSVIGNFDLEYLRSKMNGLLRFIDKSDHDRLKTEFENEQSGYKDININVDLFDTDSSNEYSDDAWKIVFANDLDSDECAEQAYNIVQARCEEEYHNKRYLRIALAFKEFITHDDIRSFLCVLTKHPSPYDQTMDIIVIKELFSMIAHYYHKPYNENMIAKLDGEEYDTKKNEIGKRLSAGEKIFVISVYQTIGAGQNLQYKIPNALKDTLIKTNDRKASNEKDFDAIYLDRPTNLMVNINSDILDDESFVKSIYQCEFLQEKGEISQEELSKRVKAAFRSLLYKNESINIKGLDVRSVKLLATKVIIQAIGRICRTNMKNKSIYIYADKRIADWIDASVLSEHIYNKEFIALVERLELNTISDADKQLQNKAKLCSSRVSRFINKMLPDKGSKYAWDKQTIEEWELLRKIVMKNPTFSEKDEISNRFVAQQFYVKLPKRSNILYYSQENDFKDIAISFEYDMLTRYEVSARSANLERILSFGDLKAWFERQGYATGFAPNDYIMSPALFNNIYKGALGEAVGWYLFKNYLRIEPEKIVDPEVFELFDYRIPNSNVYVDFKHWHDSNEAVDNRDVLIEKIRFKAQKCGCKCVIIANIISNRYFEPHELMIDGIKVISCPSLLVDKGNNVELNKKAMELIRRNINEYSDQNQ